MYTNLVILIVAVILSKFIYNYYKDVSDAFESKEHYQLVSDYYVGDTLHMKKPVLWVHTSTEVNARNWESFYSRTSTSLNQPYLHITMKSIYDKCKDSFNVCIVDDDVFRRLLSWNIDLTDLSEPSKSHYRQLGMCMILHKYGGMVAPQSFLCRKDLMGIYQKSLFVGEEVNHSNQPDYFVPGMKFMGCKRHCEKMQEFIEYQEELYKNKTFQADFRGDISIYLKTCGCKIVRASNFGIQKMDGTPVDVSELLSTLPLELPKGYGIYIPQEYILTHPKYEWFARMSTHQILESPMAITNYIYDSYSL